MAGFNREEFARRSKAELLDYIEQQSEQLTRFETRFRDVVRAYKGMLKEKEALEASLRAISGQQGGVGGRVEDGGSDGEGNPPGGGGVESEGEGGRGETSESEQASDSQLQSPEKRGRAASREPPDPVVVSLRQQLVTLTSALATLTEERAKMESSFQQDKKTLLAQQDSQSRQLHLERETSENTISRLQKQLEETQLSLRLEQKAREEEQGNQAEMLRELQSLISTERDEKTAITLQLQETENEFSRLQSQISEDRTREYEEWVQSLSRELEQVRGRLQGAEKRASEPSPLLLHLQTEMAKMKEDHQKSIQAEQWRANEAEERLRTQAQREEQRVASLESKLSELSATVGNYDRQREQDLMAIQKLKERAAQLDSENTALTKAHIERQESASAEQLSALNERVARLKVFLKIATVKVNEKAVLPSNVEELSVSDYAELLATEPSTKEYQQELYQLKEEFERYKTRAQSVLRSRGNKELEATSKEVKELQTRNNEVQSRLDALQAHCDEEEERHLFQMQKLREEMRAMDDKHRHGVAVVEAQHKQKLQDLQLHIQTTRERTLKLLREKDSELQQLRQEILSNTHTRTPQLDRHFSHTSVGSQQELSLDSDSSQNAANSDVKASLNLSIKSTESTSAVQELLEQPSPAANSETKLFHFVQEQNRRDSELAKSRRRRLELEDTIREIHEREQRHLEQNTFLKGEIRKLERDRSRETENLEYLKNVIFHYMCADSAGREQMVTPITTILHFSPEEVQHIRRKIASKRWLSSKTVS